MPEHYRRAFADPQRRGEVTQIASSLQFEVDELPASACEPVDGTEEIVELVVRPSLGTTIRSLDLQPCSYRSSLGCLAPLAIPPGIARRRVPIAHRIGEPREIAMLDDPQIAVLYSVVVAHRPSLSGQALGHDSQCVHTFLLAPGAPKQHAAERGTCGVMSPRHYGTREV
jgi:hypothetical protein